MTGDPTRDNAPTEHHLESLPVSDYDAERDERERRQRERMDAAHEKAKAKRERCGKRIDGFFADGRVHGVCLRPIGHDGDCWPVPLTGDKEDT